MQNFNENKYNALINIFLTYPVDLIVELYDIGFDDYNSFFAYYDKLTQYDIFIMLYGFNEQLYRELIKIFLGDVNLHSARKNDTGEMVLYDEEKDIVFDLTSFMIMSNFIRKIHHIPEDKSKTAKKSKALKQTLIETERVNKRLRAQLREQERLSGKSEQHLQRLITKLTIASKYTRIELYDMKLYEFYEVLNDVVGFYSWQFTMQRINSGQFDNSKVNKNELNWFGN